MTTTGKASLWVVASGTNKGESDKLYFNGNLLGTDVFDESTGKLFDTDNYDVSSHLKTDNVVKFGAIGDPFWADVAILAVSSEGPVKKPDLTVASISINPSCTRGEDIVRVYVNESNNISAVVWNNGTADAGSFDVCIDADGVKIGCVEVASLAQQVRTQQSALAGHQLVRIMQLCPVSRHMRFRLR